MRCARSLFNLNRRLVVPLPADNGGRFFMAGRVVVHGDAGTRTRPMSNTTQSLTGAKKSKNDEFYTQLADIEQEINAYLAFNPDVFRGKTVLLPCDDPKWSNFTRYFAQNFERLRLKKLISTGYAVVRKRELGLLPGFGPEEPVDERLTHGTIFTLDGDTNGNGVIDLDDLVGRPLEGDGDFRSEEVRRLRDEADVIVTNPPFSLFREFVAWIMEAKKEFLIIGNLNAISYKEVFPLFVANRIWMGESIHSGDREFGVPDHYPLEAAGFRVDAEGRKYIRVKGVRWFTNLDHGGRHTPLQLMTMSDNIKFSRHKELKGREYREYDNYNAIDVPFTDAIPVDYVGAMGVPISFLDKYCPEQFEILNCNDYRKTAGVPQKAHGLIKDKESAINGQPTYVRVLIRRKR